MSLAGSSFSPELDRFGEAQSMIYSGRRNKTYGGDHGRNS